MEIHSIHHVQLPFEASGRNAVRSFYNDLLGLPELNSPGGVSLRFVAGTQRIDLVPTEATKFAPAASHLAFEVVNLPKLRARLLDAGLTIDESQPLGGHVRFYVQDPAGNALEFLEPDYTEGRGV